MEDPVLQRSCSQEVVDSSHTKGELLQVVQHQHGWFVQRQDPLHVSELGQALVAIIQELRVDG